MVCKKDVLTWFKGLKSYKRTDLMCSLFNLCLPAELRFLGTCLEHLGKRDFHELRQAESEANSPPEQLEGQCLSSKQLRTKLAVYVSVLYSCNYGCSNSIYKILTSSEDVPALIRDDENALDELLLLYVLAINHPAFSFEQKLNLEKILHELQEEEARIVNLPKTYAPSPQEQDKPQNLPGYPACISLEDGHIIGVAPQLPTLPPAPTGEQSGVLSVHEVGPGNGALRLTFPPGTGVPPPGAPAPLILNAGGWTVIQPTQAPGGDSPMASRTSSPCSRPSSPSPPQSQQPQRVKFPPPRVPPPGDVVRDTIGKEMPKYATHLQNFTNEQLSRMTDEDLKEIGLTTCAITQLKSILSTKQVMLTNGIGPPPHHMLDSSKKKLDSVEQDNMVRRYPLEAMTVYHPIHNAGLIQPSQCYNCITIGPRKCLPLHPHYPPHTGIALGPPPPPPASLQQHLHLSHAPINEGMRNMRIDNEHSSTSDTASDHSPPDTPAPAHTDGPPAQEDRLGGTNSEERRGGGNSGHGRSRGIGRNRSNPPGIQTLPRGRGPNPSHRRRDVSSNMMNGVDDRKVYQQGGNGSGGGVVNSTGGNGESAGAAPSGYFSYMSPYLRTAYPAAYHHPAAYVRHAYPAPYHNGDLVYQYPAGPPPGTSAGTFLPPPPPPPSYSPVAPPPQPQQPPPPPAQSLQSPQSPSCYNCGSGSHFAADCPAPTIEEVTKQGQYRIDFTTNFQKQPGEIQGAITDK